MRYFYKLFLSILAVLTIGLAAMEYTTVGFGLKHSMERAQDSGLAQHRLIRHAVRSAILNEGGDKKLSDEKLSAIGENAASLLKAGGGLFLSGGKGAICDSGLSVLPDLTDIPEDCLCYRVAEVGNAVRLIVKSGFIQEGRQFFLVTEQDITQIFAEAKEQQKRCTRLYFLILGICGAAALGLSWMLTRPLLILRRASCAFGNGDYSFRAKIRSKDEMGELARDYNRMADTVQDKIRELEDAAERQKQFTANFAHELKTPMTSIIGYADMIYQKKLSAEETRQAAWDIMNEGMRLETLAFKLMDLFTLEDSRFTLEETEIAEALYDVQTAVQPLAQKRGVEFVCHAQRCWVRLEYDLFKTLLFNLIDNALKSGGSQVSLTGCEENGRYRVSVSDDGRGILEEELKHITEPFYMVDKSRSRREHGAGLGLALCARIAEIHNTKLEYVSGPGKGTTVSFSLKKEAADEEN